MTPDPVRLYNPKGPDRVAVVSAEPASGGAGASLIRLARGPRAGKLGGGGVFGPYPAGEVARRIAEVVDALRAEGFGPSGLGAMLEGLSSPDRATRARAAARLGWHRAVEAIGPMLEALPHAVDETCALLDALGAVGDPRAIPAARDYATRKLLSRRRSAVEALRNLGDAEGLDGAVARAREQLPDALRAVFDSLDPRVEDPKAAVALAQAVRALDKPYQGLALDLLYEIGMPAAVGAVHAVLADASIDFGRPYLWRYIKSVYKRALLRHDIATSGRLGHAIEVKARGTVGSEAPVKSGYDGVQRQTSIFRRKTQDYVRRLGWRYLRNLAAYRPTLYAHAAAEALVAYTPGDAEEPDGLRGAFARCYLLHRILWGASPRFVFDDRRLTFRFRDAQATKPPVGAREEPFPHLWDAEPTAYLRILGAARLPEAQAFAAEAVSGRHRRVLAEASLGAVLPLLRAPYTPTVELGLDELGRRFNPDRPDWPLLDQVLSHELAQARELGRGWLRLTAPLWTRDQEWVLVFLAFPDAATAALAAELAASALRAHPDIRRALAGRLLTLLRLPEASPGTHDVYARVGREALPDEMGALLGVPDLVAMITGGSPPAQSLAGDLLARRPEAVAHLGLEGLAALAQHEVAAVRAAAHALMRTAVDHFRADPTLLFLLVESDWADTRALAFDLLRDEIGLETLGPDGLMGLLDSNRPDVQDVGRELVKRNFAALDPRVLVARLVEHPHPNLRRFALDLVVEHLPDGGDALARIGWFFRAAMLDLRPDRLVKRRIIDFLLRRGLVDPYQGEVAARILGDFARMDILADREHALEALVRLSLAHHGLKSSVAVGLGGVA